MRHLRHLAAAVQLTHARSAHTTDAATIVTVAAGFTALLGLRQFAWALFPGAAIYWLAPAALDRALPRSGAGRGAIRLLVLRAVATHAAHAVGIGWLLGWAVSAAGVAPVVTLLAFAAVVYEFPRFLLPLVFGGRVDLGARPLKHVCLQRSDVIGDVVMATPCIESIKASSDCRVSVLCREATSELLREHPQLEAVIIDPTATGQRQADGWRGSAIGTLAGRLRHRSIDAVISLWDRPSSLYPLAALLAGIPVRAGNFSFSGGWLLNAGVKRSEEGTLHEVEQNLRRVRALGFVGEPYPRLSIALTADNVERARLLLEEEQVGAGGEFLVALSPATSGTNRRLEPAAYADFARRIHQSHGARVLLLGTLGDRELTGAILAGAPAGTVDLAGRTSVGVLAAVIANCRVHVGGDSGPAHIAGALGVPGVVISPARSQKPLRWAPWMAPHRIVRKRPNCRLRCLPSACRENFCVAAITVDDVCDAFNRVAAGDVVIAPLGGRRYWAALSLSVLVHAPDDGGAAEVMSALRLLRSAGFIEYIVACRRGGALDDGARAEGFETRAADVATLFDTIVEFGGGIVYDFTNGDAGSLRTAMWAARKMGCGARRVVAMAVPRDADAMTDALLSGSAQDRDDALNVEC